MSAAEQAQQEPYLLPPKYASRAREVMRDLQQSSIFVADLQTKIMWFKLLDVQVSFRSLVACEVTTSSSPLYVAVLVVRHCQVLASLIGKCMRE